MNQIKFLPIFIISIIILAPCFGADQNLQLNLNEKRWINENHIVRIRIGESPPLMFSKVKIEGIAIDYVEFIFHRNGIQFQYITQEDITWPKTLRYIKQHKVVDMVPTAKITDERKKYMLFTDEYIFAPWVIFIRSDDGFVSSIDDLKGKTVSVEEGFVMHEKLEREYPEINLKVIPAISENFTEIPIKELSTGLVDAYIGNLLTTVYIIHTKGYNNVKVAAPTPFENHNQAMAIRSDWPELVSIINKTLASMTQDDHLAIRNKWLNVRYEHGINTLDVCIWIISIVSIAFLIIAVFLMWNRRLKKEVFFRKQIEKDLKESQRIAHIGNWRLDIATNNVFWSEELYRMFGLDSMLPPPPYTQHQQLFKQASWDLLSKSLDETIETGMPYELELETVRNDGSHGWMWVRGETEKNASGKTIALWGAAQDITERKHAEESLRKKDTMLANIASQVPGMLYQFKMNPDGTFCVPYTSVGIKRVFYCSPEDVRNDFEPILKVIHPEDKELLLQSIEASVKNLSQWKLEYRVQIPGQSIRWAFGNAIPEQFEDGSIIWSGYNVDITEIKQFEYKLINEKERLMVTLRSIGDGVITTDINGKVFLLNIVAEKLTGWSQKDASGKHISEVLNIVNEHTRKKCENPIDKVLIDKVPTELANHTLIISRDGSEKMIADSGAPIFDSNNEVIGAVLVFRDITETYKTNKQLQQSQKMEAIATLAGGIAHDFNNMLGAITGNLSYVLSIADSNNEIYDVISEVLDSTKQAKNLTHQLLTFSKGGEPIKKVTDINKLIKQLVLFANRGSKSNCRFQLSENLWMAEIDEGQINQVIGNLVINANQAMPNGGTITIRTENAKIDHTHNKTLKNGKYINISIEDQGDGISKDHLNNIFEPFFTTKQEGSGLGLATAYSIIKRHDGHISVSSEIKKGSIFRIYLPASSNAIVESDTKQADHSGKGRILVMDDQESILRMSKRMLNRMGYEVAFALNGNEAIETYRRELLKGKPFDLLILDLTIPGGMGGAQTISEILKIDPQVKAVVSSGYSNDPIMSNHSDYGFCGILPKPYIKKDLAEILNKLL